MFLPELRAAEPPLTRKLGAFNRSQLGKRPLFHLGYRILSVPETSCSWSVTSVILNLAYDSASTWISGQTNTRTANWPEAHAGIKRFSSSMLKPSIPPIVNETRHHDEKARAQEGREEVAGDGTRLRGYIKCSCSKETGVSARRGGRACPQDHSMELTGYPAPSRAGLSQLTPRIASSERAGSSKQMQDETFSLKLCTQLELGLWRGSAQCADPRASGFPGGATYHPSVVSAASRYQADRLPGSRTIPCRG